MYICGESSSPRLYYLGKMSLNKATFKKTEHLCSYKGIESLFEGDNFSAAAYPLRIVMKCVPREDIPVKMLVSVSKRHFKHAVDRNRAKRQIREAYRNYKEILLKKVEEQTETSFTLHIAFLWLSNVPVPSEKVEERVKRLLQIASEKLCSK